MRAWMGWIAIASSGLACAGGEPGAPVRLTLQDGQVVVGEIGTELLRLEGGFGPIAVPLEDVGEVHPVEGGSLKAANGQVVVWLRNGSELHGRWTEPELRLDLSVGGERMSVDLPMEGMLRFQTAGDERWPQQEVFRVKTAHGDDLLVDPERTRITVTNALGTFSPFLSECRSVAPVGGPDGDWRVELVTGTLLIGPLSQREIDFALPLGPSRVAVPLELVTSMQWQHWGAYESYGFGSQATRNATKSLGGWFDNQVLDQAKATH